MESYIRGQWSTMCLFHCHEQIHIIVSSDQRFDALLIIPCSDNTLFDHR